MVERLDFVGRFAVKSNKQILMKKWYLYAGLLATVLEIVFAICLLIGYRTEYFAKLSGYLLLIFALSMAFSTGIKGAFDYSVFSSSAAAFALSTMHAFKYLEIDIVLNSKK